MSFPLAVRSRKNSLNMEAGKYLSLSSIPLSKLLSSKLNRNLQEAPVSVTEENHENYFHNDFKFL